MAGDEVGGHREPAVALDEKLAFDLGDHAMGIGNTMVG
jgi:hypothetical protein